MATLKEKRTCGQRCEDFGHFVWNSDNGTFMGRTPEKWVYISLYYVAFYVVMTALFSLAIWVLMHTLSPYTPDYQDRGDGVARHLWRGSQLDEDVQHPSCFPEALVFIIQFECNFYNCTKGKYFIQKTFSAPHHTKWSCPFTQSMLGECSGLEDPSFGYNGTRPCVVIKMNRIIHFLPSDHVDLPPYVNCTILDGQENVARMDYFPNSGVMDLSYFPYYGKLAQPSYVNPLVAIRFSLVREKQAKIQCRVVSDKISYENYYDPYEGKVIFNLKALK
uniref:Sodium/potassium-transporting ATPase subunit beta n=1 Tax=Mastacembelus armatus TaxID=205130 RepID=A0A7N9APH1_9TELE